MQRGKKQICISGFTVPVKYASVLDVDDSVHTNLYSRVFVAAYMTAAAKAIFLSYRYGSLMVDIFDWISIIQADSEQSCCVGLRDSSKG